MVVMRVDSDREATELQEVRRLFSLAEIVKKSFMAVELMVILRHYHAAVSSGP